MNILAALGSARHEDRLAGILPGWLNAVLISAERWQLLCGSSANAHCVHEQSARRITKSAISLWQF